MSVLDQSLASASLRRSPITIRFAPHFVNRLVTRVQRAPVGRGEIAGLLFGTPEEPTSIVQAFRSFSDSFEAGKLREPSRLAEAIDRVMATSRTDPEISALQLVGWYCVRPTGGLLGRDVEFHNLNFFRPTDIALVLRAEKEGELLMELYSRYADTLLSPEDHRWGALRLSTATPVAGPVEVTMRAKVNDDFYLRAYGISAELDEENQRSSLRKAFRPFSRALDYIAGRRVKPTPKSAPGKPSEAISGPLPPRATARAATAASSASEVVAASPAALRPVEIPAARSTAQANELMPREPLAPNIFAGDPPAVPALRERRSRSVPWGYSALVFAVAAGVTFAIVYLRGLPAATGTPGFLRVLLPESGLGLHLQTQGDRLLLSWNRLTPPVRTAREGILQIDDGTQHRRVHLDAGQVANGSVLYRPVSDDVTFKLEVRPRNGVPVTESMRVLDAPQAPVALDLSAPKPEGGAPPTPSAASPTSPPSGHEWKVIAQTKSSTVSGPAPTPQASPSRTVHPEAKSGTPLLTRNGAPTSQAQPPAPTAQSSEGPSGHATGSADVQRPGPVTGNAGTANPVLNPNLNNPGSNSSNSGSPASTNSGTSTAAIHNAEPSNAAPANSSPSNPAPGNPAPANTSTGNPSPDSPGAVNDSHVNTTTPNPKGSPASNTPQTAPPERQPEATKPPSTTTPPPAAQQNTAAPSRTPERTQAEQPKPEAPASQPPIKTPSAAGATSSAAPFVAPRPVRQVLPDVKPLAPGIVAASPTIEVVVDVDASGLVVSAEVPNRKKISPALIGASLLAAKQWVFVPATLGGKPVQSQHTIIFQFRSNAR